MNVDAKRTLVPMQAMYVQTQECILASTVRLTRRMQPNSPKQAKTLIFIVRADPTRPSLPTDMCVRVLNIGRSPYWVVVLCR